MEPNSTILKKREELSVILRHTPPAQWGLQTSIISTFPSLQKHKFSLLSWEGPFLTPRLRVGHTVSVLCLLTPVSSALFTSGHHSIKALAGGDAGRVP